MSGPVLMVWHQCQHSAADVLSWLELPATTPHQTTADLCWTDMSRSVVLVEWPWEPARWLEQRTGVRLEPTIDPKTRESHPTASNPKNGSWPDWLHWLMLMPAPD